MAELIGSCKKIIVEGKTFNSLKSVCDYYNIGYGKVKGRIRRGWNLLEALDIISKKKIINSNNLKGLCDYYKISYYSARRKIQKGFSIKQALGLVKIKDNGSCNGKLYIIKNKYNKKVYIGITTQFLDTRFLQHKRDSLRGSSTKIHKAMRRYGVDNFIIELLATSKNKHKLAKLEMEYIKFHSSIEKGYNTQKGGTLGKYGKGTKIKYKNRVFNSVSSLADYLKMDRTLVTTRLKLNIPLDKPYKKKCIKVRYKNKIFNSTASLANYLNISLSALRYRLKNNYCLNGTKQFTGTKGYYRGSYV